MLIKPTNRQMKKQMKTQMKAKSDAIEFNKMCDFLEKNGNIRLLIVAVIVYKKPIIVK